MQNNFAFSILATNHVTNLGYKKIKIKIEFAHKIKINGAQAKLCSVPENRDASFFLMQNRANANDFRGLIESRDRSGHLLASAELDWLN